MTGLLANDLIAFQVERDSRNFLMAAEDGTRVEVAPEERFVLINPQIVKAGAGEDIGQEGCLSMPGWYGDVPRHNWVTVEYQDLDGKYRRIRKADDLLAL